MNERVTFTDREIDYLVKREAFYDWDSAERWVKNKRRGLLKKFVRDCKEANERGEPMPFYTL